MRFFTSFLLLISGAFLVACGGSAVDKIGIKDLELEYPASWGKLLTPSEEQSKEAADNMQDFIAEVANNAYVSAATSSGKKEKTETYNINYKQDGPHSGKVTVKGTVTKETPDSGSYLSIVTYDVELDFDEYDFYIGIKGKVRYTGTVKMLQTYAKETDFVITGKYFYRDEAKVYKFDVELLIASAPGESGQIGTYDYMINGTRQQGTFENYSYNF